VDDLDDDRGKQDPVDFEDFATSRPEGDDEGDDT
jgi:hypothetical protein